MSSEKPSVPVEAAAALEPEAPLVKRQSLSFWEAQRIWTNSWRLSALTAAQNDLIHEALGKNEYHLVPPTAADQASVTFQLKHATQPGITVQSRTVPITLYDAPAHINEVYMENTSGKGTPTPVVMLHGYGAGIGHYHRNFKSLVENNPGVRVHALDLLGCGGSSNTPIRYSGKYVAPPEVEVVVPKLTTVTDEATFRLAFGSAAKAQAYADATAATIADIEEYYVESIELWRKQRNVESFVLFGHSYGGYMASCYAHRYPERIQKLVLLSPVGVERNALSIKNPNLYTEAGRVPLADPSSNDYIGRFGSGLPSWFVSAWNRNFALLGIIRSLSFAAPKVLSFYTLNRFRKPDSVTDVEAYDRLLRCLTLYSYNLYKNKSTSETAITQLLCGSIMAKYPLMERIDRYKALNRPVYWFYGADDWMNQEAGAYVLRKIGPQSEIYVVDKAGHNLHMDNPDVFNKIVDKIIR